MMRRVGKTVLAQRAPAAEKEQRAFPNQASEQHAGTFNGDGRDGSSRYRARV